MPISIAENRDCMDAMKEFPDKFFDLAVVDPPYGIDICSQTVHVERERERERDERKSEAVERSEVKRTQIGGDNCTSPKSITLLMTKSRQMPNIFRNSKE